MSLRKCALVLLVSSQVCDSSAGHFAGYVACIRCDRAITTGLLQVAVLSRRFVSDHATRGK